MSSAADSPEQELARREAELADARRRYAALRSRKAVRAALALAGLRVRAAALVRDSRRPEAPERPPAPPQGPPVAAPPEEPQLAAPPGGPPLEAPPEGPQLAAPPEGPPIEAPPEGPPLDAPPPPRAPDPPGPEPAPAEAACAPAEPALAAEVAHCWPMGHFYSPVPDTIALASEPERGRVWPQAPHATPGIDWREDEQVALVRELAGQAELAFPTGPTGDPADYHTSNTMFSRLDAWALQAMLRWLRPARMIEVGCGWSSLVAARVNREYLDGAMALTCVEPYPPDFLDDGVDGIARVLPVKVQDVPLSTFAELGEGDVLFIDSSHVAKTGSDCNYLYQQVLPRLQPGVAVHVHDIFLPWDYPPDWVLAGRGWNEQYVLQAFLAFNGAFEILLANAWLSHAHPEALAEAIPGLPESAPDGGGSIWLRRTG